MLMVGANVYMRCKILMGVLLTNEVQNSNGGANVYMWPKPRYKIHTRYLLLRPKPRYKIHTRYIVSHHLLQQGLSIQDGMTCPSLAVTH